MTGMGSPAIAPARSAARLQYATHQLIARQFQEAQHLAQGLLRGWQAVVDDNDLADILSNAFSIADCHFRRADENCGPCPCCRSPWPGG
jgi:hypothetical protein